MQDSNRTERSKSTLPLHLQCVENVHLSRGSEDQSDGIPIFHDRRLRPNSMWKRTSSSHKNGNGQSQGETISIYYINNDTSSTTSLSSLSQSDNKYNRRKYSKSGCYKFLGQQHQLFLMMVALVVLSSSFAFYYTSGIFMTSNDNSNDEMVHPIGRAIDGFTDKHQSKGVRPRIVTLGTRHFGSNNHYAPTMINRFVTNLVDLPEIIDDNSSPENQDATAAEPPPSPPPPPPATTNSSVVQSPPTTETKEEKICVPMAKWMTASYPNCNSVHEIDMEQGVLSVTYDDEEDLKFLGQGWFRVAWKYVNDNFDGSPSVVLKTLRIEREFLDEYYDLHRRDAIAMERLTFSPYVVNVHGYCGQSAINELAAGIADGTINDLEKLNRRLRGKETDPQVLLLKLQLASKVSLGLAHVHNVHISDNSGGRSKSVKSLLYEHTSPNSTHITTGFGQSGATMTHYDINPRNIAIMKGGSPKLNDFNIAEFMTYDPRTNKSCGFRSRLHEPWWRAPEEMDMSHQTMVGEKVDVYALGEVLFHILTTHGPRGKMKKDRMDEVRELVRQGVPPTMWEPFASGGEDGSLKKNPIVKAFMKAMDMCFEMDPAKRGTSIQVARVLHKALLKELPSSDPL